MAGKTEVEVIRDWFINIFMPVEKTADIEVTDFKFEQLNHLRAHHQAQKAAAAAAAKVKGDPGVDSDGSNSLQDVNGSNFPFTGT